MGYYENKARAQTKNTEPTLTDQAGARDTDINVIVGRFRRTGMVPASQQQPMAGDFTALPQDLRGYIEAAKQRDLLHARLPDELKSMKLADLMALTDEEIVAKLKPAPKPEPQKGDDK